jgi:hypothetical protein
MLCDTGPLVALIDADDAYHAVAQQTAAHLLAARLETTWPCLTEALYLLGKLGGPRGQDQLLQFVETRFVTICALESHSVTRMRALMNKYRDHPMDFADASLVVAAELLSDRKIFTLDQHFRTYLIHDQFPFEVIP